MVVPSAAVLLAAIFSVGSPGGRPSNNLMLVGVGFIAEIVALSTGKLVRSSACGAETGTPGVVGSIMSRAGVATAVEIGSLRSNTTVAGDWSRLTPL